MDGSRWNKEIILTVLATHPIGLLEAAGRSSRASSARLRSTCSGPPAVSNSWQLTRNLLIYGGLAVLLIGFGSKSACGQSTEELSTQDLSWDRVVVRSDPSEGTTTVFGKVLDLQPRFLELELPSGTKRRVNRSEIVSVHLLHDAEIARANRMAQEGKIAEAGERFEGVIRSDRPHWLKRYAATRRIQCLRYTEQYRSAVAGFLGLVQDDPENIPWEAVPLAWSPVKVDRLQEEQIRQWLASESVWERMAGASLGLLHGPTMRESRQVLDTIAQASNVPKELSPLAHLANAQLWRLPADRSETQLTQLRQEILSWPAECRAGPWWILGNLYKQKQADDQAADAFLKVATVYQEQHDLVLLGLDAAYRTLQKSSQRESASIAVWMRRQFPNAPQTADLTQ